MFLLWSNYGYCNTLIISELKNIENAVFQSIDNQLVVEWCLEIILAL